MVGISANLAHGQRHGHVPSQTGYAIFTGALGIIASFVGIVALFVSSLDGIITWVLDGVTSLALLAGGIVSQHRASPERNLLTMFQGHCGSHSRNRLQ